MNQKLLDVIHWITVLGLWVISIAPLIGDLISKHLHGTDLIVGICGTVVAAAAKLSYYVSPSSAQ